MLDEATSRDEISRVVNMLTKKVSEVGSNSKSAKSKSESSKGTEIEVCIDA
jgi:hypothetical protein